METSLPVCHAFLVTETTSSRYLGNHKTLKNSQTVADRWLSHTDTKNHLEPLFPIGGAIYRRFPLPARFFKT
jgi:hypothetical protein